MIYKFTQLSHCSMSILAFERGLNMEPHKFFLKKFIYCSNPIFPFGKFAAVTPVQLKKNDLSRFDSQLDMLLAILWGEVLWAICYYYILNVPKVISYNAIWSKRPVYFKVNDSVGLWVPKLENLPNLIKNYRLSETSRWAHFGAYNPLKIQTIMKGRKLKPKG